MGNYDDYVNKKRELQVCRAKDKEAFKPSAARTPQAAHERERAREKEGKAWKGRYTNGRGDKG